MTLPPVIKTLHVPLTPATAFDLFTAQIGTWWPTEIFSISAEQGKPSRSVDVQGHVGGEIFEIADDGSRHVWGTVTDWNPGMLFASTWHPGRTAATVTHIRVVFEAKGQGAKVTLTHSNWESLGEEAPHIREGYESGWGVVLARFEDVTFK